jgi:hypothetical protein
MGKPSEEEGAKDREFHDLDQAHAGQRISSGLIFVCASFGLSIPRAASLLAIGLGISGKGRGGKCNYETQGNYPNKVLHRTAPPLTALWWAQSISLKP